MVASGVDEPARFFEDGRTACHALTQAEQRGVLYLYTTTDIRNNRAWKICDCMHTALFPHIGLAGIDEFDASVNATYSAPAMIAAVIMAATRGR